MAAAICEDCTFLVFWIGGCGVRRRESLNLSLPCLRKEVILSAFRAITISTLALKLISKLKTLKLSPTETIPIPKTEHLSIIVENMLNMLGQLDLKLRF